MGKGLIKKKIFFSAHKLLCFSSLGRTQLGDSFAGLPGVTLLLQSSGSTTEAGGPLLHVLRLGLPVGWEWSLILMEAVPGFLMWWSQGSKSPRAKAERLLKPRV